MAFIPFYIQDHFTLKIENASKITLTTKQSIELKEMATTTLDLGLILGFKGKINEINFVDKSLFLFSAPSIEGLLFNLQKMTIFNCNEKPICISAVVGKGGFWDNSSPSFHEGELKWGWGCKFWATPTANFFVGGNRLFPHQKGKRGIF